MSLCQLTLTPKSSMLLPSKKPWNLARLAGGQSQLANPIIAASRPTVTVTLTTSLASRRLRSTTRSIAAPNNGAITPSTTSRARGAGHPQPNLNCQ
jgi:hypothetical protein